MCYFVGGPSGSSGDEYLSELKESVKELSLSSHVEFLGNLPQVDIRNLLNSAKLLIHTSTIAPHCFQIINSERHICSAIQLQP